MSTQTSGAGTAGDLTIATAQLIVREQAEVNVSSKGTSDPLSSEAELADWAKLKPEVENSFGATPSTHPITD